MIVDLLLAWLLETQFSNSEGYTIEGLNPPKLEMGAMFNTAFWGQVVIYPKCHCTSSMTVLLLCLT